jgi:hypothetical protein
MVIWSVMLSRPFFCPILGWMNILSTLGQNPAVIKRYRDEISQYGNVIETKCRSSKTLQGWNVGVVKHTADKILGGRTVQVEMSHGHFVGGHIIKAPEFHTNSRRPGTYSWRSGTYSWRSGTYSRILLYSWSSNSYSWRSCTHSVRKSFHSTTEAGGGLILAALHSYLYILTHASSHITRYIAHCGPKNSKFIVKISFLMNLQNCVYQKKSGT